MRSGKRPHAALLMAAMGMSMAGASGVVPNAASGPQSVQAGTVTLERAPVSAPSRADIASQVRVLDPRARYVGPFSNNRANIHHTAGWWNKRRWKVRRSAGRHK